MFKIILISTSVTLEFEIRNFANIVKKQQPKCLSKVPSKLHVVTLASSYVKKTGRLYCSTCSRLVFAVFLQEQLDTGGGGVWCT